MHWTRAPFFLQGSEWEPWLKHTIGVPRDATRYDVAQKIWGGTDMMNQLFLSAGRDARNGWGSTYSDSMDSHRLAYYAATLSDELGEAVWKGIGERYFEGRHNPEGKPVYLASHEMLLAVAEEAGLDLDEAKRVLASDAYREDVEASVSAMKASGINSIPVLIFSVDGVPGATQRHNGSGNKAAFRAILDSIQTACEA